ncbi:LOW QUALITY PROTEIN: R3H and coiled-coil domain-containing protein 1 [Etheostoma spectabile]|uniref:LOW QUALITY PROTEIN: R3H and coiled-coil domain-containing protein 1 n=1 Tax=Etheostoma spectabile TaxID=54343 RepID=UPI0013AFB6D3|nr:LOW QUALITY PROTEIN: R3H and coiled-coil domain-containing protein 1-like [Etheostoma spectabile]
MELLAQSVSRPVPLSTLAFPCFDGIYLPKQENKFLHNVKNDLEIYQQKSYRGSVLLFPPLPSRLRFLIHKTIEDLPELTTFSVGESWCRRVVVCHSEFRGEVEEDSGWESNNGLCEIDGNAKPKSSIPLRSRGPKRPDKPLYMPRVARERLSLQNSPSGDQELPSPASSSCSCLNSQADSCFYPETTEKIKSCQLQVNSCTSRQECVSNVVTDSSELCPQEEKQKLVQEAEPLVWEQTVSCFSEMTLEEDEKGKEDICTDTDDVTEEIKAHLKETVTVSIQHVQNDYSTYENVCIGLDTFPHVIEIYGFPQCFKTDDLLDAFIDYSDGGIKIEWVDDTHALGIFSSETAALHALSICHPMLKARALAQASKKAKGKAIKRAEFIQPVKERPRTDCAVARRMVTRALGLQGRGRVQQY